MEVDRRPIAAKRTYVTSTSPDVLPRHVPLVPLANTASFALEARRRPVAAARVGVSVASEAAGVSPTLDVLDVLAKANRPAQSFIATAAGAMEMSRRPKAARRVSPAIRPSKVRKETPAPNLADTAWAAMEARRRPRATKRAAKLRDSVDGDFVGQHSVLHPEQVGEFALDANQLAEHAAWRLRMVNAAVDEAGDKVLAAMTDRALSDLARLNLDKDAAAKTAGGDAPNPFAALERMLDARMSSESPSSRGRRIAAAPTFPDAAPPRTWRAARAPPTFSGAEATRTCPTFPGTSSLATSTGPRACTAPSSLAGRWFAASTTRATSCSPSSPNASPRRWTRWRA